MFRQGGSLAIRLRQPCLPRTVQKKRSFFDAINGPTQPLAHRERRLLAYPPNHVYAVVSDVARYKHFVPWCIDSRVLLNRGNSYLEAELTVGFHLFSERYISRVTLEPGRNVTAVARDTQLFHHLRNEWTFTPHWSKPLSPPTHGQGKRSVMRGLNEATGLMQRDIVAPDSLADSTWLAFNVDFSFRGALYAQAANLFFDEVVSKMVGAFEARCAQTWDSPTVRGSLSSPKSTWLEARNRYLESIASTTDNEPSTAAVVSAPRFPGSGSIEGLGQRPISMVQSRSGCTSVDTQHDPGNVPSMSAQTGQVLRAPGIIQTKSGMAVASAPNYVDLAQSSAVPVLLNKEEAPSVAAWVEERSSGDRWQLQHDASASMKTVVSAQQGLVLAGNLFKTPTKRAPILPARSDSWVIW